MENSAIARVWFGSALCYVAGILWIFLFPLVSISTGELKPRGIYIDESSLQSYSPATFNYETKEVADLRGLCERLSLRCSHLIDQSYEIILDSLHKPISDEVIAIVLPYYEDNIHISHVLGVLCENLVDSEWLAKRVLLLLLPSHNSSSILQDWIYHYHHMDKQTSRKYGLLREAYVIDLIEEGGWDDIVVNIIGSYGRLPNMDILASILLTDHKNIITLESDTRRLEEVSTILDYSYRSVRRVFTSNEALKYSRKLFGLFAFMFKMSFSLNRELHDLFLNYNIDSLTIRPRRLDRAKAGEKVDIVDLLTLVEKLIRSSSNLEGLHQYLLCHSLIDP